MTCRAWSIICIYPGLAPIAEAWIIIGPYSVSRTNGNEG